MTKYEFSSHALSMMKVREIHETWIERVIENAERKEEKEDGTVHYVGSIDEFAGRYLRIVINTDVNPFRIVTLYFDRKLGRKP